MIRPILETETHERLASRVRRAWIESASSRLVCADDLFLFFDRRRARYGSLSGKSFSVCRLSVLFYRLFLLFVLAWCQATTRTGEPTVEQRMGPRGGGRIRSN